MFRKPAKKPTEYFINTAVNEGKNALYSSRAKRDGRELHDGRMASFSTGALTDKARQRVCKTKNLNVHSSHHIISFHVYIVHT